MYSKQSIGERDKFGNRTVFLNQRTYVYFCPHIMVLRSMNNLHKILLLEHNFKERGGRAGWKWREGTESTLFASS